MEQKEENKQCNTVGREDAQDMKNNDETDLRRWQMSQPLSKRRRQTTGIYFGGKTVYDANKDSDWVVVLKCLLVIAICFGGLIVPSVMDWGPLMTGVCMIGAPILAVLLMKNT